MQVSLILFALDFDFAILVPFILCLPTIHWMLQREKESSEKIVILVASDFKEVEVSD